MQPFGPSGFASELEAGVGAPRAARRLLVDRLAAGGFDTDGPGVQAALLVMSEMTTNAVVHTTATETIHLQVDLPRPGVVRLAVCDSDPDYVPERTWPSPGEVGGWGVELVRRLSDSWGFGPRTDGREGKEVWAQFDIESAGVRFAEGHDLPGHAAARSDATSAQ